MTTEEFDFSLGGSASLLVVVSDLISQLKIDIDGDQMVFNTLQ